MDWKFIGVERIQLQIISYFCRYQHLDMYRKSKHVKQIFLWVYNKNTLKKKLQTKSYIQRNVNVHIQVYCLEGNLKKYICICSDLRWEVRQQRYLDQQTRP